MRYKRLILGIFWICSLIGIILLFNRIIISFLPSSEWRILMDHLFAGFLIPLWVYILLIGIVLFIYPDTTLNYEKKWFIIPSMSVIIVILIWEGFTNNFSQVSQILADLIGLTLSWIYFIKYKQINKII
ncbi:MAG: hypothetical protein ACOC3Z_02310 [Nanoarchaeota archaeon]